MTSNADGWSVGPGGVAAAAPEATVEAPAPTAAGVAGADFETFYQEHADGVRWPWP